MLVETQGRVLHCWADSLDGAAFGSDAYIEAAADRERRHWAGEPEPLCMLPAGHAGPHDFRPHGLTITFAGKEADHADAR